MLICPECKTVIEIPIAGDEDKHIGVKIILIWTCPTCKKIQYSETRGRVTKP
jgi:hypothetical protein